MPASVEEHNTALFEAAAGGRDYGARPEYYIPYDSAAAQLALVRAQPLSDFLKKQPQQQEAAEKLAADKGVDLTQWLYVPVVGRQDWIALLNAKGHVDGFLRGDGF